MVPSSWQHGGPITLASDKLLFEADCTTGTIEAVVRQWVRGWEAVRLPRLEPAIRNTLGCGRPRSGFAILINNPNKLMFYAKWAD